MVLVSSTVGNAANAANAEPDSLRGMEDSMRAKALSTVRNVAFAAVLLGLLGLLGLPACKKDGGGSEPGASSGSGEESEGSESAGPATPNSVVHKSGGKSVTALIGPPGGVLSIASGAKVEIPAGTLPEADEITLADASGSTAFLNSEHERPVGPVFVIAPAMEAPDGRKIRVSIPLAAYPQGWGDVQMGYEYPVGAMVGADDATHTKWQTEPAKLVGGRAVAEVPALPGFRLQFVLSNLESQ
jgi:hypothetical protein